MFKIRKEQLDAFENLARRERRAFFAKQIAEGDDRAHIDEATGNVVLKNSRGDSAILEIDSQGIKGLHTAEGRYYSLERNRSGRLTQVIEPSGQSFDIDYEEDGLIREIRRGGKPLLHCEYSDLRDTLEATFADGVKEHFEYEGDRLIRTVDANGGENRFVRDAIGEVVEVVNPLGHSTRFEYDEEAYRSRIVWADGVEETYQEHDDGSLTFTVNNRLHATVWTDDENDIERAEFADGHFIEIEWDGERPVRGINGHSTVEWNYDAEGRLVREKQGEIEVAYEYDEEGNLVRLKTSDGQEIRYRYDADDLPVEITLAGGREIVLEYDPAGAVCRLIFPNEVVTEISTSAEGLYASIVTDTPGHSERPLVDERYEYDARGRLSLHQSHGSSYRYRYDPGGRLICVETEEGERLESFEYDAAGNRTANGTSRATFDARNQIVSAGTDTFQHDMHGNMVGRAGSHNVIYHYNGQGHLVEVQQTHTSTITFAHDAFGRRIRKQIGDSITYYLWSGRQLLREWTVESGEFVERRDYVFFPGGEHDPLAVVINGEAFYYHTDRLGTPLAMSNEAGDVVWHAEYSAFGEARILIESVSQPLRFLGQYYDLETDLHYNVFRYYDSRLGRYLTPDPIRYNSGSINLYPYANNDPINQRDPEGHLVFTTALLVIGGVALAGGLIGGAISAATAESGERASAFVNGFGWGVLGGTVGAAVPIIGAAAGLGTAAIVGLSLGADAIMGGIEACVEGVASVGTFLKGAGIAVGTTIATLGLSKLPGVKRALGAIGKQLSRTADTLWGRAKQAYYKLRPGKDDAIRRGGQPSRVVRRIKGGETDPDRAIAKNARKARKQRELNPNNPGAAEGYEAEIAVIKNRRENFEEAGHEVEVNGQDTEIDLETHTEVIEVKSGKLPNPDQLKAQREYAKSKGKNYVIAYDSSKVNPELLRNYAEEYPDVKFEDWDFGAGSPR